ncbi:ABC transporter permease subunit [Fictibacillus sp. BK138]|uniref:ABC transporter permease subunit n=1 Tax=Fictibacillus sp. BK138 TaxID=2512121 RepID=UPI00102A8339|nr:ABC transporter permease subunit [Fictibacillus sp. BK138]RZT24253.1 peptide/nickel transport system permease protein [Fictibacillus sp. BK138]
MRLLRIQFVFSLLLAIIGIFFIGSLPFAFVELKIDISLYIQETVDLFRKIINPMEIVYFTGTGIPRSLFPALWEPYFYSLSVLTSAFILAIIVSIILTLLIYKLPSQLIKPVKKVLYVLESVPDILVAVAVQMFIIWFFKTFNILLFPIAVAYEQNVYLLPIMCLTILPTLLCTRILLYDFEQEMNKPYVDLASGKGLTSFYVLWRHILPNAIISFFFHSKNIWWFMLSNLLIIEYLFNIYGITTFMLDNSSPEIFTIGMLLMFVPIYLSFSFIQTFIIRLRGDSDA